MREEEELTVREEEEASRNKEVYTICQYAKEKPSCKLLQTQASSVPCIYSDSAQETYLHETKNCSADL